MARQRKTFQIRRQSFTVGPWNAQLILTRQERRQFLHDHLLANGAEGAIEIAHATVELRAVDAAVIIVGAFEESDRPYRNW